MSNGTVDQSTMDLDSARLAQMFDQGWTDIDFANSIYGQQDASISSGFSCGSLTSGSSTPQSSTSASTSRRQSLASSVPSSLQFPPSSATAPKQLATPRTPIAYDALYQGMGAPIGYLYSILDSHPIETCYPMEFEASSASAELHMALAFGQSGGIEAGSSSPYNPNDFFTPQTIFENGDGIAPAIPFTNQYSRYNRDRRPYQAYKSLSTMSRSSEQLYLETPQTVAPAQTTYTVPRTPPPTLAEPFVSPTRPSLVRSLVEEGVDLISPLENFAYLDNALESPRGHQSCNSDQSHTSPKPKLEENEDPLTVSDSISSQTLAAFADRKSSSKGRICRRNRAGRRSVAHTLGKAQRHMPGQIRYEPEPQNICPHCKERKAFRRPEHLNRHLKSLHVDGGYEPCKVPGCLMAIRNRPDNMKTHYKNTHLYEGDGPRKGKKNIWVSIERAIELGLGDIDPRTNPPKGRSIKKEK